MCYLFNIAILMCFDIAASKKKKIEKTYIPNVFQKLRSNLHSIPETSIDFQDVAIL